MQPRPADPAILGLDNVRLDLPLAGAGSRVLAGCIDLALLFLLLMIWWVGGALLLGGLGLGFGWTFALLLLGGFLLQWGYFAILEILMEGRTPGKLAVGLRVVSHRGGRTTATAILVRNLLRALDIFVGVPMMAIDRRCRRLGDLVAGTLVVHQRESDAAESQLGRHPASWGAREVAVVESFLRRAEKLDRPRAEEMADRILRWIERREPGFWAETELPPATAGDRVLTLRRVLEVGG